MSAIFDLHSMQPMPAVRQPFGGPCERFRRREELVPVVDGADVGIAGIGASLARRIGDHHLRFVANVIVGFAQRYGVPV